MILWIMAVAGAVQADGARDDPRLDGLARCIAVQESAARLACFDAAARTLVAAARDREIVVVKRADVVRTRRSLFGIGGEPGDALLGDTARADRIETLDTKVASATRLPNDRWALQFAEGGRWQTTEAWALGTEPKAGVAASIRRGALGSYMLKVPGERGVRVRRIY